MSTVTTVLSPSILATAEKFRSSIDFQEKERGLIGRRHELHVMQLCIVTRVHPFLFGPPGVAKSMSVDGVMLHLPEMRKFKTQAYKASPPEQFIGPISIRGMENDQFVRIITGKLADCEIGIVDEVPRAPRSILPAFQGMMVEREFDSGMGVVPVPLQSLVGTGNHIPDDSELEAFMDRWTFKLIVKPPQSQDDFVQILKGALRRHEHGDPVVPDELIISRDELTAFQKAVTHVHVDDAHLWTLAEMWSNVTGRGVVSSPRRYVDLITSVRGVALLDGRDEVSVDDLQIAADSLWNQPDEAPIVYEEVVRFASAWMKDKSDLLNTFADTVERLGQIQTLTAAGTPSRDQVTINDRSDSITQHAIEVLDDYKKVAPLIEKHIAAATGQDTSALEAALGQIAGGRQWIADRLMGGLTL